VRQVAKLKEDGKFLGRWSLDPGRQQQLREALTDLAGALPPTLGVRIEVKRPRAARKSNGETLPEKPHGAGNATRKKGRKRKAEAVRVSTAVQDEEE
jgi:hypothetical protein